MSSQPTDNVKRTRMTNSDEYADLPSSRYHWVGELSGQANSSFDNIMWPSLGSKPPKHMVKRTKKLRKTLKFSFNGFTETRLMETLESRGGHTLAAYTRILLEMHTQCLRTQVDGTFKESYYAYDAPSPYSKFVSYVFDVCTPTSFPSLASFTESRLVSLFCAVKNINIKTLVDRLKKMKIVSNKTWFDFDEARR